MEEDVPCDNFLRTGELDDLDNQEIDVCIECQYHRLDHKEN
jgi:hypothetical protein